MGGCFIALGGAGDQYDQNSLDRILKNPSLKTKVDTFVFCLKVTPEVDTHLHMNTHKLEVERVTSS